MVVLNPAKYFNKTFHTMKNTNEILHLHIVNTSNNRFVVYYDQFPDVTAQGKTEKEARLRLQRGLMKRLNSKFNISQPPDKKLIL